MPLDEIKQRILDEILGLSFDSSGRPQPVDVDELCSLLNIDPATLQKQLNILKTQNYIEAIVVEDGLLLGPQLTTLGSRNAKERKPHVPLTSYRNQLCAVLCADFKSYSKITDLGLRTYISEFFDRTFRSFLTPDNHLLKKTSGDGLLVISYSCSQLAEFSLRLRDAVITENWARAGFAGALIIRIALHTGEVKIRFDDAKAVDSLGPTVDVAARVEPIVDDNSIFCTKAFADALQGDSAINISPVPIGTRTLPKNFGDVDLFNILWDHEVEEVPEISIPRVKKQFSDSDVDAFVISAFQRVTQVFHIGLTELQRSDPLVKVIYLDDSSERLLLHVTVQDRVFQKCKIWLARSARYLSICYDDQQVDSDNDRACNEELSPGSDGFQLYLSPLLAIAYRPADEGAQFGIERAATYLWDRFSQKLGE